MFEHTSRYYSVETATLTTSDGRTVAYVRRRFLPRGRDLTLLTEVSVVEGDRLDLITHRTLGDGQAFWRVCDINDAMNPFSLLEEPGSVLKVPVPKV